MALMTTSVAVLLVGVALVAGIGCTAIGPGGIFTTIALYTLTSLPSSTVAGTAHLTFVGVAAVGTLGYVRSGELTEQTNASMAVILSITSVLGAFVGTGINTAYVSRRMFGLLLGCFAVGTGLLVLFRESRFSVREYELDLSSRTGRILLGALGILLGVVSSLLGVGGQVITVPILVVLGVPMLAAVGVAQVQSILIATSSAVGYLTSGNVSPSLALLIGVPQLIGAVVGWRVAHRLDPVWLKVGLGIVLVITGSYLVS